MVKIHDWQGLPPDEQEALEKKNALQRTPEENEVLTRRDWQRVKLVHWSEPSTEEKGSGKRQLMLVDAKTGEEVYRTGSQRGEIDSLIGYLKQSAEEGSLILGQPHEGLKKVGIKGGIPPMNVVEYVESKTRLYPDDPKHEQWIASSGLEIVRGATEARRGAEAKPLPKK